MLDHLKANNRAWAERKVAADAGFFRRLEGQQAPRISVDRLLRQPRARQRDRRPRSRRAVRAPQRRQPRPAAGRQLPLGAAVRRRRAQGEAHHGGRPLRLRRRRARRSTASGAAWSTTGCTRSARSIQEHRDELEAIADERARLDRLCELNVIRQVRNVASDVFVQDAWARGQELCVHGWVYSLANGLVTDLDVTVARAGLSGAVSDAAARTAGGRHGRHAPRGPAARRPMPLAASRAGGLVVADAPRPAPCPAPATRRGSASTTAPPSAT